MSDNIPDYHRWREPNRFARFVCGDHKTCWNCQHIQVATMFSRRCGKELPDPRTGGVMHVFGSPFDELDPDYSNILRHPGRTVADDCESYQDADGLDELPENEVIPPGACL